MALKSILIGIVVLGIAGAVLTQIMARRHETAVTRDFPPVGAFVEVEGKRVHYVQEGSGPDLVLIHGASGNLRDFTFDLMPALTDRYRVTAFDRPGLGYTDRENAAYESFFTTGAESPSEQAAMLRGAAQALGIERPVLLGHSFGNAVALAWVLDYPQDAAALVDVAGVSMPWPGDLGWFYEVPGSLWGGAVVPPLVAAWVPDGRVRSGTVATFAPDAMPEGYADHLGPGLILRRGSFRANARQVNGLRPYIVQMATRYDQIDLPVEIVHGSADTSVPLHIHSGPLSQIIPGAVLTVLDGRGHMPHHTDPEAVIAAIDRAAARAGLSVVPAATGE